MSAERQRALANAQADVLLVKLLPMPSNSKTGEKGSIGDRLHLAVVILSTIFLAFVIGAWVILSESFPYSYLHAAYQGGMALWKKQTAYDLVQRTDFWTVARSEERGVTVHDPDRAYEGLTLYTSGHDTQAILVSMTGEVVHKWQLPYSEIWDETAAVKNPRPDSHMYWRKAHVYPNGDLLAIYIAAGDTPWGYGAVKVDKNSNVIWKYLKRQTHHDFDITADGRIYLLTHRISNKQLERFRHLKPPRIEDFVVVLSPEGKELKRVSIIQAFLNSPYGRMLSAVVWYTMRSGDYMHTNAIDVIDRESAGKLPFASEGQVLLSFRELHTIAVLDLDKEKIVWAMKGPWIGQHDPDILSNGDILIYDNLGRFEGDNGRTRILQFDPVSMGITWRYHGAEKHPFDSNLRGSQQRLPNGNTLITESSGGRIFEVTPDGDIVWEYYNPVRTGPVETRNKEKKGEILAPVISWAQRIEPEDLDMAFRTSLGTEHGSRSMAKRGNEP